MRGDNPVILIEADATDPAAASNAIARCRQIARRALLREQGAMAEKHATDHSAISRSSSIGATIPKGISQYNIVPGLLGVILQMTMVMMTAMALTRETERGTMENLLAMPATPFEIMIGKVLPFIGVGAVQVAVVLSFVEICCSRCRSSARLSLLARRHPDLHHGAGAARLHILDAGAHADAGDAADLLLLPAVDPACRASCSPIAACRTGRRRSANSCR